MVLLLAVVFLIMALTGTLSVESGQFWQVLFNTGRGWILIGVLVGYAAIQPYISFGTVEVPAQMQQDREAIINAFSSYGYGLGQEEPGKMVFRANSRAKRATLLFDDAITVTDEGRTVAIEGKKKEISRVETRLRAFVFR